jgi:hypothetical protein
MMCICRVCPEFIMGYPAGRMLGRGQRHDQAGVVTGNNAISRAMTTLMT